MRVEGTKLGTAGKPVSAALVMPLRTYRRRLRASPERATRQDEPSTALDPTPGARKSELPRFFPPQLATLVDRVPQGKSWLHEIKLDGYRIISRLDHGRVRLLTREAHDWSDRFDAIAGALAKLPAQQAILDGEVVALNAEGSSDFQLLQNSIRAKAPGNLFYYVFDILHIDGYDLTAAHLLARKERLQSLLGSRADDATAAVIRFSDYTIGDGQRLFQKACAAGLEGIVSKRTDQPYRSTRSRDWLKIKCVQSQEFVIGGFTDPAGSRAALGALLLGVYDEQRSLRYAGRVGTGFSAATLAEIRARLDKLAVRSAPFANPPRQTKKLHWVKPDLVGEVAFTGWTKDGLLRHPSFKGLREDKPALQVRRESPAPATPVGPANKAGLRHLGRDLEIAGVRLTHENRILYPKQGITKFALARYYASVAQWMMPHIEARPLTLLRCPDGQHKHCFYQRHIAERLHRSIRRVQVEEKNSGAAYIAIDSLAGLIALVQMGVLEFHTWQARAERLDTPDQLIFDLDPDPATSWHTLKKAALMLRERLSELGLRVFLKTTGGNGLHLVVPIAPTRSWPEIKRFTRSIAETLVTENPQELTATMSKAKRKHKIFIDYLRNSKTATAVCAYSARASASAPVSLPLDWTELKHDPRTSFTVDSVPERLRRLEQDPWREFEAARTEITDKMVKAL